MQIWGDDGVATAWAEDGAAAVGWADLAGAAGVAEPGGAGGSARWGRRWPAAAEGWPAHWRTAGTRPGGGALAEREGDSSRAGHQRTTRGRRLSTRARADSAHGRRALRWPAPSWETKGAGPSRSGSDEEAAEGGEEEVAGCRSRRWPALGGWRHSRPGGGSGGLGSWSLAPFGGRGELALGLRQGTAGSGGGELDGLEVGGAMDRHCVEAPRAASSVADLEEERRLGLGGGAMGRRQQGAAG